LAALAFLVQALSQAAPALSVRPPQALARLIRRLSAFARRGGGFPLGMALGLLPCGLLYGSLLAAASSGDPAMGAAGMVAFGVGTLPALVAVGMLGQAAAGPWRRANGIAAPVIFAASAILLLGLALRLLP